MANIISDRYKIKKYTFYKVYFYWVNEGSRTPDLRNHNPTL